MTYTCAVCHETFESGWTDAEARAEYEQIWKKEFRSPARKSIVCDVCYQRMKKWKTPEQYQAERKGKRA
jgi:hypothetical protein